MTAKPRISYQGEPGANSHIACLEARPDHEPLACRTFEDAFQAVKDGTAALAMIPIDNSVAGRVADIHHLMPQSNLSIIAEHFLPVHHQLLKVRGADEAKIREVHSHVHALGQCRKVIRARGLMPVVAVDTAGAARELAERGDTTRADIVQQDIEDESHNTTRFVILSPERRDAAAGSGDVVTSFVFRVRNVPASLYKAMGGFATNGVNMTKLESYQLEGQFSATQFYADIEGHPDDAHVRLAFEELAFFTSYVRVLGAYKASPYRAEIARKRMAALGH
jgi:prephenate dehydratase